MRQDDGKIERQTERLTVAVGRLHSLLDAANAMYVKHLYTHSIAHRDIRTRFIRHKAV